MLDRRILPILTLAVPLLAIVLGWHVFGSTCEWAGRFEWVVSATVIAATLATVVATWSNLGWLGIAIPALLLAANAGFVIATLFGVNPVPGLGFASDKFAVVLAAGTILAIVGLGLRQQWARWLAVALGAAGIGCGVLNAINYWSACDAPGPAEWHEQMCATTWVHGITALGGVLIVLNLVAARASFVANETWSRPDPVVRWLRWLIVASFVAVPMLLVYAWMQPIVPATQTTAVGLALALALGAILAVRGKAIGALLLVIAGGGLTAQTIATYTLAGDARRIAVYYAVFWIPAAVIAMVCGGLLARPMVRLLRDR